MTDNQDKGINLLTVLHNGVITEMQNCSDCSGDSKKVTRSGLKHLVPNQHSVKSVKAELVVSHKYWKCLLAIAIIPNRERGLNMTVKI